MKNLQKINKYVLFYKIMITFAPEMLIILRTK